MGPGLFDESIELALARVEMPSSRRKTTATAPDVADARRVNRSSGRNVRERMSDNSKREEDVQSSRDFW